MAAPPPKIVIPPAQTSQGKSTRTAFISYVNSHPALRPWAQGIYRNALDYGIDPVYFASLINTESGGNPNAVSSAGAIGLGQIMPLHVGEPVPWAPGKRVTLAALKDPAFNLRWSAYFFGKKLSNAGGNYQQAYSGQGGYNPGGPTIFRDVPKAYVPTTTAASPTDVATRGVEVGQAKADLTQQWAVFRNGKVKFVTGAAPPQGALTQYGQPLSASDFLRAYASISDVWQAYTNKRPSYPQAAAIIKSGKSDFRLKTDLAQRPDFVGSPVWKQNAPGYIDVWHQVYGPDAKPDQQAIRTAIVNNVGGSGFADALRQRSDYTQSNEFKQNSNQLTNVYRTIFGEPRPEDTPTIEQAALHGYTPDMFANYLRHQPQYKQSPEYLSKVLTFGQALGLVTGQMPTLKPGTAPQGGEPIPTDPRAKPSAAPGGLDLVGSVG